MEPSFIDILMKQTLAVSPLMEKIKKLHKNQDWHGTDICPICKNTISITHSKLNGHLSLRCKTENCINIIEQ